jgi:tetratricopeptide (TPR) repeat protein
MRREPIPLPVRDVLVNELPVRTVERIFDDAMSRRAARRRARVRTGVALGLAAAAVLASFVIGREIGRREIAPVVTAHAPLPAVIATGASARRVRFDDGSWLEAAPRSRVEIEEDAAGTRLSLARGGVELEVEPRSARRIVVETALARVIVVGTRFSVVRGHDDVRVTVVHGLVRVQSPWIEDGVAMLSAGEDLVVRRALPEPPPTPTVENTSDREPRPRPERLDVDALFREADDLQRAGRPRDAIAPLERILAARPRSSDAALAAFTLGRLYDDVIGDRELAVRAFERSRSIGLPSGLDVEARARLERLASARSPEDPVAP